MKKGIIVLALVGIITLTGCETTPREENSDITDPKAIIDMFGITSGENLKEFIDTGYTVLISMR